MTMKEFADMNKRPDNGGVPTQLRTWLAGCGKTLAEWRADQQRQHDPAVTALALRRRRLALLKAR